MSARTATLPAKEEQIMSDQPNRIQIGTLPPSTETLRQLQELLPGVVMDGVIDAQKISEAVGLPIVGQDNDKERFGLMWSGKKDAVQALQMKSFAGLQIDSIETPLTKWDVSKNVFIEGDNLEVLKLLQKAYNDQVKAIYIDPPYNTGNDFVYKDDFSDPKQHYLEVTGQLDIDGNRLQATAETSGRKHSNWLSMLFPRLYLARNLLAEDGVIFISIDDGEVANLRALGNEIFGEENFITSIIWQKKFSPANDARWFSDTHDFILVWARNKEIWRPTLLDRSETADARYKNIDNDPRGSWTSGDLSVRTYSASNDYPITTPSGRVVNPPPGRCWRASEKKFRELINDNRVWFGEDGSNTPRLKRFLSEVKDGITPTTIWLHGEVGHNQEGVRDLQALGIDGFTSPKPVRLIKNILRIAGVEDGDIVLDFFAGSGTTAQAVAELNNEDDGNRKFVLINIDEPTPEGSPVRNSGYLKVPDITKARINAISELDSKLREAGVRFMKLSPSAFINQEIDTDPENLTLFQNSLKPEFKPEDASLEILLKHGVRLDATWQRSEVPGLNTVLAEGVLLVLEQKMTNDILKLLINNYKFHSIIFFESAFEAADSVKANAHFTFKQMNISMKTV